MHSLSLILCTTPLKSVIQILALHIQNVAMNTPPSFTVSSGMQSHKQLMSLMPAHNEESISATHPNTGCYPIIHSCCFFYPGGFAFLYLIRLNVADTSSLHVLHQRSRKEKSHWFKTWGWISNPSPSWVHLEMEAMWSLRQKEKRTKHTKFMLCVLQKVLSVVYFFL